MRLIFELDNLTRVRSSFVSLFRGVLGVKLKEAYPDIYHQMFHEESQSFKEFSLNIPESWLSGKTPNIVVDLSLWGELFHSSKEISHTIQLIFTEGFSNKLIQGKLLSSNLWNGNDWIPVGLGTINQLSVANFNKKILIPEGASLQLKMISPLRLMSSGTYLYPQSWTPQRFAMSLINRARALGLEFPSKKLEELSWCLIPQKLVSLNRLSKRSNKRMNLFGHMAMIQFNDTWKEFTEIIYLCSLVGIGKNTVFGFGRYQIEILYKDKVL
jgi:hypothetical protein